jgi:tetratricopeptide (TPR) repeat protein
MPETSRNALCPCGSGKKFKNCHGAKHPEGHPPTADVGGGPGEGSIENPFRRIFKADGTVNRDYVMERLKHLEGLLKENRHFLPLRYDRETMESLLAERQDIFANADKQEDFEKAFGVFSEMALPILVTKEFDEKAKELLREALNMKELTARDRAGAACGIVLSLPEEGEPAYPLHENPFFDLILRVTFNESMTRVEFLQKLAEEDLSEMEREVRLQEFLRSVPALMYELHEAFQGVVKKALKSYERGDYSFGIGVDMTLHGVKTIRKMTREYEASGGEKHTEEENREFSRKFGEALTEAFEADIGEDETEEIFERMVGFLEGARNAGAHKAANGLSSALEVMERNPEMRHRMIFAAYHEAVTGSRIFRDEAEEKTAQALYADPDAVQSYIDYGECLEAIDQPVRAERVYRAALVFFPEDEGVRSRLTAVATALEPIRQAALEQHLSEMPEEAEAEAGAGDEEE